MNTQNYVSARQLTVEELKATYRRMDKERLIEMLIACNKTIDELYDELSKRNCGGIIYTDIPKTDHYTNCSDWNHCSNPYRDCINCPLRYSGTPTITVNGSGTISTNRPICSDNEKIQ